MCDLISVIIPVYNAANTLERCINSVLAQSYENIEVILVNDGSSDESDSIIKHAGTQDNRIKYIYKDNTGVSDTRNVGVRSSSGKYICFIDADDYVDENYLQIMISLLKKENAEIATCGHYRVVKDHKNPVYVFPGCVYGSDEAISELLSMGMIGNAVWDKLFSSSIIRSCPFPNGQIVNEELFVLLNAFSKADKVVNCGKPLYYYCLNNNSVSQTYNIKKAKIVIENLDKIDSWVQGRNESVIRSANLYRAYFENAVLINLIKYDLVKEDTIFYEKVRKMFKKDIMFLLRNNNISKKDRFKSLTNWLGLYALVYRLVRKK